MVKQLVCLQTHNITLIWTRYRIRKFLRIRSMEEHVEGSTTTKNRTPINKIHILLICRTYNYVRNMAICLITPSSYWKLARKHVKWFISLLCHWRHSTSCVCVETRLGGEGKHSNLDTHTPTLHVQTQMEHNSSPQVGGMEVWLVVENQSQDLLQWSVPPVG